MYSQGLGQQDQIVTTTPCFKTEAKTKIQVKKTKTILRCLSYANYKTFAMYNTEVGLLLWFYRHHLILYKMHICHRYVKLLVKQYKQTT